MIYKILIRNNKSTKVYSYYTQKIGTEEVDYSTEYLAELSKTYKALLATYTTDQIKLVHELEPNIVINLEDESASDNSNSNSNNSSSSTPSNPSTTDGDDSTDGGN